jgi:hypothetical protein
VATDNLKYLSQNYEVAPEAKIFPTLWPPKREAILRYSAERFLKSLT